MIVSRIRGGLGNQLFTYAAGRCLAVLHDTSLLLDTSWYCQGPRPFYLRSFNIHAEITKEDQSGAEDGEGGFNQENWNYYPEFLDYSGYKFLSGWWQSERFFEPISSLMRQELTFSDSTVDAEAHQLLRRMQGGRSGLLISVHCRRCDYVGLAAKRQFTLLEPSYYRAAMSRFPSNSTFLLFSDDPNWCRENLNYPRVVLCDIEDTLLSFASMKLCDHHIIANSTFSWWAAWLGEGDESTIIAPQTSDWFGPEFASKYVTSDIVPSRWIQLPLND
jgi:hypothetical protein